MIELLPEGHVFAGLKKHYYKCISVDAPHKFVAGVKSRPQHYARMTDIQIAALPVKELVHPDGAWMFFWALSSKIYRPPGSKTRLTPQEIAAAWGFKWSARAFLWVKLNKRLGGQPELFLDKTSFFAGTGLTTVKGTEDCFLFRIGKPPRRRGVRELIVDARREHSRKPTEALIRMEKYCDGPRLEMFSRSSRNGWDTFGDEAGLFEEAA